MVQDRGTLSQRVIRSDTSIGPDLQDQTVIIRALSHTGAFHGITNTCYRRKQRIDRDHANGLIQLLILITGAVSTADAHIEFHIQLALLVQSADQLIRIHAFHVLIGLNIRGGHRTLFIHREIKSLRIPCKSLEKDLLQVQNDLGDILHHIFNGGKLVHRAVDLDIRDGRSLQRGKQHPAQSVAQRIAVTGFKRFSNELRVGRGRGRFIFPQPLRHFKTA